MQNFVYALFGYVLYSNCTLHVGKYDELQTMDVFAISESRDVIGLLCRHCVKSLN